MLSPALDGMGGASAAKGWRKKNSLLLGSWGRRTFIGMFQPPARLPTLRYVLTLDSDTRLPRVPIAALRKMMHPVNTPVIDPKNGAPSLGHALMQAAAFTPSAVHRRQISSVFQRVFSAGAAGMDPYVLHRSELYQDLLTKASFTGQGIYDVRAFRPRLMGGAGSRKKRWLLSHGPNSRPVLARAAFGRDVQVVEGFPCPPFMMSTFSRQHRWIQGGDWAITALPFPRRAQLPERAGPPENGGTTCAGRSYHPHWVLSAIFWAGLVLPSGRKSLLDAVTWARRCFSLPAS